MSDNNHRNNSDIRWRFLLDSKNAWEAMLEDCRGAKESISVEQYIFEHDGIGRQFAEVFSAKAKEGVRVRLLLDMAGSYDFYNSTAARELERTGVEILWHNVVRPWRINNFSSWFFRDHKKILIVDSRVAHVGGVGIRKDMEDWRDTNLRLEGNILWPITEAFENMWEFAKEGRFLRFDKPRYFIKGFQFLTNSPKFQQRFIYHNLIDTLRSAREKVWLTTPYFVPDLRLFRVLRLAAKRGVDVRLLLPENSDHLLDRLAGFAAYSYFGLLLKAGVRIFLYEKGFLHAKTVAVDGRWASVGSANLDNLSLLFNYEANIVSSSAAMVQELEGHFNDDISACREVKLDEWRKRSRTRKLFELLSWPIHKFL